MNLFMFYIGGSCGNSNIELHDIRFSTGEKPEDCYADLRKQWWGDPKSLHLDCFGKVEQADGYDVILSKEPEDNPLKLFFLNLGGYDGINFEELHKNILLVEETPHKAVVKALKMIRDWQSPHRDNIFEVEKVICINDLFEQSGHYIHLKKAEKIRPFEFVSKYIRINA